MVATGHPINEGELEVAATEDEACLGACAVAPAPQVPQGLEAAPLARRLHVGRRVHLPAAVLLLLSQSPSVIKNIQN